MVIFLGGILFLIAGYLLYGKFVEHVIRPKNRKTPCIKTPDGVDFVPLPQWKNMLIQLLNIAGVGPVIGVIVGIKFGKIALLLIPVGCVFMGAVHDYLSGSMSLRMGGANLPKIIRMLLGKTYAAFFSWVMLLILLLVVAVFINVPATLIDNSWLPQISFFWWAAGIIFLYYIAATLFPVDKIIGSIYPLFGALLIIGSLAVFVSLVVAVFHNPDLLGESEAFLKYKSEVFNANGRSPIFPLLFVTIACGIISGFHATQSPIVARTMKSEREARATFYGMMILEGIIAMIWAAAALAVYNSDASLLAEKPAYVLNVITMKYLGSWMGTVTVFAVIVLAITSGDTALRSCRLSLAEMFSISQLKLHSRVLTSLPLMLIVAGLLWWSNESAKSFNHLWNYFAWGNQVLSATTLMAASVWLYKRGRKGYSLIALLPAIFMTTVVVSFILWTSADKGQPWGLISGGIPLPLSILIGFSLSIIISFIVLYRQRRTTHCDID